MELFRIDQSVYDFLKDNFERIEKGEPPSLLGLPKLKRGFPGRHDPYRGYKPRFENKYNYGSTPSYGYGYGAGPSLPTGYSPYAIYGQPYSSGMTFSNNI